MDVTESLARKALLCEKIINRYLPECRGYSATVIDAMKYSVNAGGKRIRPVLMMETCALFGGATSEELEPFVAAIEMIHTYSLVHDDLPAMDNDDYRRGRKTTHKVYGEAMAILAGDGLLNLAFEVASEALIKGHNMDRLARAMRILAVKPGYSGMIGGQTIDLEAEGGRVDVTTDLLNAMYEGKTSALIQCAMTIGAVLAGASEADVEEIEQIGNLVGLAFQIQDDILDIEGDEAKIGKPLHSDEKNNKSTYVSIVGIDAAKEKVKQYSNEAIRRIKVYEEKNADYDGFLSQLFEYMIYRDK